MSRLPGLPPSQAKATWVPSGENDAWSLLPGKLANGTTCGERASDRCTTIHAATPTGSITASRAAAHKYADLSRETLNECLARRGASPVTDIPKLGTARER